MNTITWPVYITRGIRGPANSKRSIAEWEDPGASLVDLQLMAYAIERAKRAQAQSLHYYRKWNYIMQENLVVTWPPVRPYVSPPLDGMLAGMKVRIDAPTRTDF